MTCRNLFFLFFGLLWISVSFGQNFGNISGKIQSTENNAVLSNVEIVLAELEKGAVSDLNGEFFIDRIPEGKYTVEVTAIGYGIVKQRIYVVNNETANLNVFLTPATTSLAEVTLKGGGLKTRNETSTVNTISLKDIKDLNISTPQDLLYELPGVERIDLGQGGAVSQIGMRGFELGGHGGDIAMEVDGVSFNETEHSGGYVDMNIIIPLNLSRVKVYKGPSSPLFGLFARGGALSFETRKGGEYTDIALYGGSYEQVDAQVAVGHYFDLKNNEQIKTNFAVQATRSAGYTANADYLKANINGRLAYDLSDKTELAVSLNGHASNWDAPGFITADMLHDKKLRRKQAVNAEKDGGEQVFASERIELNHSFQEDLRLLVYAYSIQQSQTRFSKFGIEPGPNQQTEVTHSRKTYSMGASINGNQHIGSIETDWVGGLEFYNEFTDRTGWSTFNRVRTEDSPYQDNAYRLQYFAAFGQAEFNVSPYFRPSLGFRYEIFDGRLNKRLTHENSPLQNLSHFSPKIGFRSTLVNNLDFRANVSNGYSLPTGDTKYSTDIKVEPEKLWQYEVGLNYIKNHFISADLSAYLLKNSHERTFVHGEEDLYLNSGKTERKGVELNIHANPFKRFQLRGSFAYQRTKITDLPDSPELEGNELTNLPKTISSLYADYTFDFGLGLEMGFRNSGKYATNRINTDYYAGYTVADAKIFFNLGKTHNKGRLFFEINNLFNENYATYALDFTSEFGIPGGVFYSPAPMRNFKIGVSYTL